MPPSLDQLPLQTLAVIRELHVGQEMRRRMAGLGLRPGCRVMVVRASPLKGPLQVRVGSTDIILRRSEAARIEVNPAP